jgi:hypothetical protein
MAIASGVKSIDLAHALAMVANQATEQSPELAMAAHSSKFPLLNRIKRMLGKEPARFSYSPLITKTMLLTLIFSAILLIGNANEDQASKERWLSTALETEFELSSQYLFDTLQKPEQVARPQVIVEEEVGIIASPEPVENVHEEVITRTFNISNKTTMVMDSLPNPPVLNLTAAPVLDFQHGFSDSSRVVNISSIMSEFGDSIQFFARNIAVFQGDTSVLSQSQREKLNAKIEVLQLKMANSQKVLEQKMKEWEKEFQPKMEEFERKMEAWQKENEPRLKEFEEKIELWAKEQAEKLKLLEKEQELKEKKNKEKQE